MWSLILLPLSIWWPLWVYVNCSPIFLACCLDLLPTPPLVFKSTRENGTRRISVHIWFTLYLKEAPKPHRMCARRRRNGICRGGISPTSPRPCSKARCPSSDLVAREREAVVDTSKVAEFRITSVRFKNGKDVLENLIDPDRASLREAAWVWRPTSCRCSKRVQWFILTVEINVGTSDWSQ